MNVLILISMVVAVAIAAPQRTSDYNPGYDRRPVGDYDRRPVNQIGSGLDCRYRCQLDVCNNQRCKYKCHRPASCEQNPIKATQYAAGLDEAQPAVMPVPADAAKISAKDSAPSAVEIPTAPASAAEPVGPAAAVASADVKPMEVTSESPRASEQAQPVEVAKETLAAQPLSSASLVSEKSAVVVPSEESSKGVDPIQAVQSEQVAVVVAAPAAMKADQASMDVVKAPLAKEPSKIVEAIKQEAPMKQETVMSAPVVRQDSMKVEVSDVKPQKEAVASAAPSPMMVEAQKQVPVSQPAVQPMESMRSGSMPQKEVMPQKEAVAMPTKEAVAMPTKEAVASAPATPMMVDAKPQGQDVKAQVATKPVGAV